MKTKVINQLSKIRTINNFYSGIATIFMLHRVSPFEKEKLFPNENMKVSPEFLESFILKLKDAGYEFISLDRLSEILKRRISVKNQIVFTLDDGYLDNYTYAYQIFKRHNVPFTIYLTTSFPNKNAILWWYIIEDLIIENETIDLSSTIKFECKTEKEKINAFMQIRELIIDLKNEKFFEKLRNMFSKYEIDWYKPCINKTMTWQQIIELSKDDLVTIGGHTLNHFALNKLTEKEIIYEILAANKIIEENTNKKVNHFAYPFGSEKEIGIREFEILKKLDFKTATTTRSGNIFHQHINHLESLPRLMLTQDFDISKIGSIRRKRFVTS